MLADKPLAVARADKKKLAVVITIRAALITFGYFLRDKSIDIGSVFNIIWFIVMAIVILFPLRHITDYIEFYPNAICTNGKSYSFSPQTAVTWSDFEGHYISSKRMVFSGISINITYLKDVKALFYRTYGTVH